jgi:hypothetical protein
VPTPGVEPLDKRRAAGPPSLSPARRIIEERHPAEARDSVPPPKDERDSAPPRIREPAPAKPRPTPSVRQSPQPRSTGEPELRRRKP